MRRAWLILFVAVGLVALATPAVAGFTHNERYSEAIAEGGWSSGDWGDATIVSGYVGVRQAKGAASADLWFYQTVGTLVTCDNGTPDDPDDDFMGYEWTELSGGGPATLSVAKSYSSASAEGTVEAWTGVWNECDWYGGEDMAVPHNGEPGPGEPVQVSLALTGEGPRITTTGSYSFHIPGQYNEHSRNRSVYRSAAGVATVDGVATAVQWGQIGEYSWSSHANGK